MAGAAPSAERPTCCSKASPLATASQPSMADCSDGNHGVRICWDSCLRSGDVVSFHNPPAHLGDYPHPRAYPPRLASSARRGHAMSHTSSTSWPAQDLRIEADEGSPAAFSRGRWPLFSRCGNTSARVAAAPRPRSACHRCLLRGSERRSSYFLPPLRRRAAHPDTLRVVAHGMNGRLDQSSDQVDKDLQPSHALTQCTQGRACDAGHRRRRRYCQQLQFRGVL